MKKLIFGKIICMIMAVAVVCSCFGAVACKKEPAANSHTVTFSVQGHGTAPAAQTVNDGEYASEPASPTADGWTFGGWYKEADCQNKYGFATEAVTKDITLYAKWTENSHAKAPTIYLAGDSTVKTYEEKQYIGGWGQFLDLFLDGVTVKNAAQGGRSSRSFINEGRLYDIDDKDYKYSFSQNDGKSIGSVIEEGDFLFIQFGHNDDDTKKASSYSTLPDRMVPLGTPDSKGIYPVTAPTEKKPTTSLPQEYLDATGVSSSDKTKMANEIAKYGSTYYSYDCGGTYKWYLKQYIEFAREKGATPVLVTPVARVSFNSNGTLKSGPGLHGEDFAYVKAVRQLAEEEDCLLIDLFAETKTILETATQSSANYLMALVPNDLDNGPWPTGYDTAYNNTSAGFQKIEGTHYNKYGAYITAAKLVENILASAANNEKHQNGSEYFSFTDFVKTVPSSYIDPSNLLSKSKAAQIEALFTTVNPVNPNRTYPLPKPVIDKIAEVCTGTVTGDNYLQYKEKCDEALTMYNNLNIDDRSSVTNYSTLKQYIAKVDEQIIAHRPKPVKTVEFNPESVSATGDITTELTVGDFKVVGASGKAISIVTSGTKFEYGKSYDTQKSLSLGGSATFGSSRYIEFTVEGACTVTVVAKSTSASEDRTLNLVKAGSTTAVTTFAANGSQAVTSQEIAEAGTYQLGSSNKGAYLYYIIIEYYA